MKIVAVLVNREELVGQVEEALNQLEEQDGWLIFQNLRDMSNKLSHVMEVAGMLATRKVTREIE